MKSTVNLKYFVTGCLLKHFFDSNSPQILLNLIPLVICVALMPSTLFEPKIRAVKLQKMAKIYLTL